LRRPARSALTFVGLTLVVVLILVVVAFLRGLETTLAVSGDPHVVLIHSLGAAENLENSSIAANRADVLAASLRDVQRRFHAAYVSPELYLGTRVHIPAGGGRQPADSSGDAEASLGLVRGVTLSAPLVHRQVQITEGRWPEPGEILVGRLAATKLGLDATELAVGQTLKLEGRSWRISGRFAAGGSTLESELWCRLEDLQQAMIRQDLSLVAVLLAPGGTVGAVQEFCRERRDLEIQATAEVDYYRALQAHYRPVRIVAWLIVCLVAGAGVFACLNTMYGAVVGRVRELATLQTIGFSRRAIVLSIIQEGALLAAAGSLLAALLAVVVFHGAAVRFTMGAFTLRVDSVALVLGCGSGVLLGMLGAVPPALRALRLEIADGLKAV
jgi:ABC-type lipoprotein release transport system permease subunit